MLADVHIYVNHIETALEQLERPIYKLPKFSVNNFKSIFDFRSEDVVITDYICGDKLNFEIAV